MKNPGTYYLVRILELQSSHSKKKRLPLEPSATWWIDSLARRKNYVLLRQSRCLSFKKYLVSDHITVYKINFSITSEWERLDFNERSRNQLLVSAVLADTLLCAAEIKPKAIAVLFQASKSNVSLTPLLIFL